MTESQKTKELRAKLAAAEAADKFAAANPELVKDVDRLRLLADTHYRAQSQALEIVGRICKNADAAKAKVPYSDAKWDRISRMMKDLFPSIAEDTLAVLKTHCHISV